MRRLAGLAGPPLWPARPRVLRVGFSRIGWPRLARRFGRSLCGLRLVLPFGVRRERLLDFLQALAKAQCAARLGCGFHEISLIQ
jgi:hypothetical protein